MVQPTSSVSKKFVSHLTHLEKTRAKMEKLVGRNDIVRRDIEQMYSGLYIDAITSFERLIENLFIGLLAGKLQPQSRDIVIRVKFSSGLVAHEVVCGGRPYVDWFPYNQFTEPRAKAFFRNGLPFTKLSKTDRDQIQEFLWIRNAIAHKSPHSSKKFCKNVIKGLPLTPLESSPAGFLRSIVRDKPKQTRYEILVIEMSQIAKELCE